MDSTPSKSLTDEIMDMVDDYAARSVRVGRPIPESKRFYTAIRSRLQSLETELTELRNLQHVDGKGVLEPQNGAKSLSRNDVQYVDGSPCSSPIELGDETAGICWDGENGG